MKVGELINELNKIEDKTLDIRVLENNPNNPDLNMENYWLHKIEVYDTANIYGECEYAIPITSTGQIKF